MPTPLHIILLTHEREVQRKTNTGIIALNLASEYVERVIWERINPNQHLLNLLSTGKALLLYPADNAAPTAANPPTTETTHSTIDKAETIIIIDSTWQEAQKIFNKSPYLQSAPKAVLTAQNPSTFTLRRNQPEGGLCTIECIIELCKMRNLDSLAEQLTAAFAQYNQRP
jgi:DTW domain-containing protein YfiP